MKRQNDGQMLGASQEEIGRDFLDVPWQLCGKYVSLDCLMLLAKQFV